MKNLIVPLIIILVGAAIMALTLSYVIKSSGIKKNGISAEGTVVNIGQLGRKTELEKVTVSFNTTDGAVVTASASKREYVSVGDKVVLWYDKADPQRIDFGDTIRYNMRGVFVGAIFVILGIYFFIMHRVKVKPVIPKVSVKYAPHMSRHPER